MSLDTIAWNMAYVEISKLNTPWRAALGKGRRNVYPKGHSRPMGKALFFLENGCVNLRHIDFDGNEKILWYIRDDSIFGEAPFFCNAPMISHFTCVEDCVIYSFDMNRLNAIFEEYPELSMNLVQSMAYKIRILAHQTASFMLDSLIVRLCKFISQYLVPGSEPLTARIGISKQEIANIIGANRISLYKILKEKEEEGLWSPLRHGKIIIYKPEVFFRIVAG